MTEYNFQDCGRCSWMLLPCRLVRGQMPAASGFKHSSNISGRRRPLAQRQRGRPQHPRRLSRCHLLHPSPSHWSPCPCRLQTEAASKDSPEKVSRIKITIIANIQPRFISTSPPPVPSKNSCGGEDAGVSWRRNRRKKAFHKISLAAKPLIWLFIGRMVWGLT